MGYKVPCKAVLVAVAVGSGLLLLTPTPAYADKSISASLGQSCSSGQVMTGGTFTLTNVSASQQITVNTLQARTYAPSSPPTGGTALYNITFNAPLGSPPAVATVPSNWSGSFSLTSAQCVAAKAPSINVYVSLCGTGPVVGAVVLKNNNPVWTKYTVSLAGQGSKTAELSAGETDQVDFQPLTRGVDYGLTVAGSDGTNNASTVSVPACPGTPPGPIPTAPGSTQPIRNLPQSPSASPEASAGAEQSASPEPEPSSSEATFDAEPTIGKPAADSDGFNPVRMIGIILVASVVLAAIVWWLYRRFNKPVPLP